MSVTASVVMLMLTVIEVSVIGELTNDFFNLWRNIDDE